jgi:hypothetical protein
LEEETAVIPGRNEIQDLMLQASSLLKAVREHAGGPQDMKADDLLLFLYRLRDGYRVVHSSSDRSKGNSFGFLPDILYQLESRPDATLESEEWNSRIELLLRDLAEGRLMLLRKGVS